MKQKGNLLYDVLDVTTGELVTYEKTTTGYDGTTILPANEASYIDGVIYIKIGQVYGGGYAKRVCGYINPLWYGITGNGSTSDLAKTVVLLDWAAAFELPVKLFTDTNISLGGGTLVVPQGVTFVFEGGIFSNGTIRGNKTTIQAGNFKIFHINITLTGTFNMPYICPEHYGAIANSSNTIFENECSAEIKACIDAPIHAYLPNFYYITETLVFSLPKTLTLRGNSNPGTALALVSDHGRIYTDQDDLELITIQSRGVSITGGVLDVTQADDFVGTVVRVDCNYPVWGFTFNNRIVGSKATASKLGKGGRGIWIDQSDNVIGSGGYATFMEIGGDIDYMHTGFYADPKNTTHSTYFNSTNLTMNMVGCKKFLDIGRNSFNRSNITGQYQVDGDVLAAGEEDFLVVDFGGNNTFIDVFPWDLDRDNAFRITGTENQFGPRSNYYFTIRNVEGHYNLKTPPFINPSRSLISKFRSSSRDATMVSKLDSETVAFDKRYTVTMKAYKGATVDFDVDLDETSALLETTDITLANTGNLFNFGTAPSIEFTEAADLENDFVEIVMSGFSIRWQGIYLFLTAGDGNAFKRVQLIEHYGGGVKTAYNIYPPGAGSPSHNNKTYIFDDVLAVETSTKTIIRLIGNLEADNVSSINDIMGISTGVPDLPYLHPGEEPQTKYGPLTTTQYKLSALNTAPASAGSTGVLGDIRITADYIYVCTATNTWKRTALTTW